MLLKNAFLVLLALKLPFIGQPNNHMDLERSMPFMSIRLIFREINSWKFGQKQFTIHKVTKSYFTKFSKVHLKIQNSNFVLFCSVSSQWVVMFHTHYNGVGFFSYKVKGGPKCTIPFVAKRSDWIMILFSFLFISI